MIHLHTPLCNQKWASLFPHDMKCGSSDGHTCTGSHQEKVDVVDCSEPERFAVQGQEMDGLWPDDHSHSQQVWGWQSSDNA